MAEIQISVGFSWDAPNGQRKITAKGPHPITGLGVFGVKSEGQPFVELIPQEEILSEVARDKENLESRQKTKRAEEVRQVEGAEKKRDYENVQGFAENRTPFGKASALSVLNGSQKYNGLWKRRKDFIAEQVTAGRVVETRGGKRVFLNPEGAYFDNLAKIELDYAEYLKSARAT